jgi:hypothetical protein
MVVAEYSFDLLKNYPTERRYLIKKALKKTFFDSVKELLWKK